MKKIIATVLAMVMALALCTTAFAASEYVVYDKDKKAVEVDGSRVMVEKVAANSKDNTTVYYALKDGNDVKAIYIPATASDFSFYVENNYVKEVLPSAAAMTEEEINAAVKYTGKLVSMTEESPDDAEISCTTNIYKSDVYYDKDGKGYVEATANTTNMLYNGVILKVAAVVDDGSVVVKGSHLWVKGDKVSDGVYNVKCAICGATSVAYQTLKLAGDKTVAKYDQQAGIDTANELDKVYEGELLSSGWYVATAKTANTTNGTSSPKTFDAGIAMYVGMALTSVAGSAVVIGKKKEF